MPPKKFLKNRSSEIESGAKLSDFQSKDFSIEIDEHLWLMCMIVMLFIQVGYAA